MRTLASLMQAILLTQERPLTLEDNDLPPDFVRKILSLGHLEEDAWFSKRQVRAWRLGEVDEARKVRVAKEEAAKAVSAQKLLVAQQGKLGAMMNKKGKFVDLWKSKGLSHHHLLAMSPVISKLWIASVITGFSCNCFTAEVLKAHLTIINSEIEKIPCS